MGVRLSVGTLVAQDFWSRAQSEMLPGVYARPHADWRNDGRFMRAKDVALCPRGAS